MSDSKTFNYLINNVEDVVILLVYVVNESEMQICNFKKKHKSKIITSKEISPKFLIKLSF